ncbi:MAG: type toxin-antitoxin system prevent-host-death family antitoxin [Polaromonas sp.]|nr:type toxin-antitoxin system prevent-host-death family antitoxin [Polaromonas sp.]
MLTVNIHEAKTHLSRLIERAAQGESFIIAKAGKPMVRVVPIEPETLHKPQRLGFMKGKMRVPDDFDTMYADEIARMFNGED